MTQAELDSWLAQIKYKPGWKIIASPAFGVGGDFVRILVQFEGPDCADPDRVRPIGHWRMCPLMGFDYFVRCVHDTIAELEAHERREWFMVKGKQYQPPHEGGRAQF